MKLFLLIIGSISCYGTQREIFFLRKKEMTFLFELLEPYASKSDLLLKELLTLCI
jgi:hypothetical protein